MDISFLPSQDPFEGLTHAERAFVRRIQKVLRGDQDPRYAFVVMGGGEGDAYAPYVVLHANRTDAAFAATQLLLAVLDMERDERCPCESCDQASLKARAALEVMGVSHNLDRNVQ